MKKEVIVRKDLKNVEENLEKQYLLEKVILI